MKNLLNEAEKFLLEHWQESRSLEESMESVRRKFDELFERIVEEVTDAHPELDCNTVRVTQLSTSQGSIGFGKKSWPTTNVRWFPGLWIDGLRLENLSADDSAAPIAGIWIPTKIAKAAAIDLAVARATTVSAAQQVLSSDELPPCAKGDPDEQYILTLPMPSKRDLLSMFADRDGQRFADALVAKFDVLARFIPVLDELLLKR